jgi:hypothetical protein
MPSFNLGLPAYVDDQWWNFGFSAALAHVTTQQRGADSVNALNYYSAVIAALNAINSQSVPSVPAFGATATQDYCYTLASLPQVNAKFFTRITVMPLSVVAAAT